MATGRRFAQALIAAGLGLATGCSGGTGSTVTTSTTLTSQDVAEINTLINSPDLQPLQPNSITSDGGVVFATSDSSRPITSDGGIAFVTQALRPDGGSFAVQQGGPGRPPPPRHLKRYGRKITEQQPLQVDIQAGWGVTTLAGDPARARATLTSVENGELDFEPTEIAGLRRKTFREQHVRLFLFQKNSGRWGFTGVSPVKTGPDVSQHPRQDVAISRVVMTVNGVTYPLPGDNLLEGALAQASQGRPALRPGDTVRIEVTASNADGSFDPPLFVFLSRPSTNLREQLLDDGLSGDDAAAHDGTYTRSFVLGQQDRGLHHLRIDAFSTASVGEDREDDYRAATISFAVDVKDPPPFQQPNQPPIRR